MVAFTLYSAIPSHSNNCLTAAEASGDPDLCEIARHITLIVVIVSSTSLLEFPLPQGHNPRLLSGSTGSWRQAYSRFPPVVHDLGSKLFPPWSTAVA